MKRLVLFAALALSMVLFADWNTPLLETPLTPGESRSSSQGELPYCGEIQWDIQCDGSPVASLAFFDIVGNPLDTRALPAKSGTLRPSPLAATFTLTLENTGDRNLTITAASVESGAALRNYVNADWIWEPTLSETPGAFAIFRTHFDIPNPKDLSEAFFYVTADDRVVAYLNDTYLEGPHSGGYDVSDSFAVLSALKQGQNTLTCRVLNGGGPGGLLCELHLIRKDGTTTIIPSSTQWRCAPVSGDDPNWKNAPANTEPLYLAKCGENPWGKLFYSPVTKFSARIQLENLPTQADENTIWTPKVTLALQGNENVFGADSEFSIRMTNDKQVDVLLAETIIHREELKNLKDGTLALDLPAVHFKYIPNGVYTLQVQLSNATLVLPKLPAITVRHSPQAPMGLPSAELVSKESIPQFQIDGHERIRVTQYLVDNVMSSKAFREEKRAFDAGIKTLWIHHVVLYDEKGNPDFRNIDSICASTLARNPEICIVINPALDCVQSPQMMGFFRKNPEELCVSANGGTGILNDPAESTVPVECNSMASQKWLEEAERVLGLLIDHLESTPYGRRVVAIAPSVGITWEWMNWGSERLDECTDYSKPFTLAFQRYAQKKYGTIKEANAAWNRAFDSFNAVQIPTADERQAAADMDLLMPQDSRYLTDLYEFIADTVSDDILDFCGYIKKRTQGRTLTCIYYGYYNMILVPRWLQGSGHWALSKVLASDDVDMIQAPSTYIDRGPGGPGGFMPPESAITAAGKVFVTESDIRTHHSSSPLGLCGSLLESRGVLERELGSCLANNVSFRFYDFNLGWVFCDTRLAHLASLFSAAEKEILDSGAQIRAPEDAIAVVISESMMPYLTYSSALGCGCVGDQYRQFPRTGLAFKVYTTPGLGQIPPEHRFWFFENPIRMTPEEIDFVKTQVMKPGNTLVLAYGANVLTDEGLSTDTLAELTGLDFQMDFLRSAAQGVLTPEGRKYLQNPVEDAYPSALEIAPKFYPLGSGFTALAKDQFDNVVLAETEVNGCRVIFTALPNVPSSWIRNIATQTGLHCFNDTDGDVTWASGNVVTLHTPSGGTRTIHTRHQDGTARNLLTGEEFPIQDNAFTYEARDMGTDVFLLQ